MKRPATLQKEWMCSTVYYSPRIPRVGCAVRCYLATEGRNNSLAWKQLGASLQRQLQNQPPRTPQNARKVDFQVTMPTLPVRTEGSGGGEDGSLSKAYMNPKTCSHSRSWIQKTPIRASDQ